MEKITQKKIKQVCDLIVEKFNPQKIILFGSFAWGKPNKDSDVDLMIVKNSKRNSFLRQLSVRRIIKGVIPVDILVYTPKEIKNRLNIGDFFIKDIIQKGKIIYEK